MAQYLSGSCMNPTPSTLLHAIRRNHFQSWPGMTTKLISKHLPKCIATGKGYLDQDQKNIRSTKLPPSLHGDYTDLNQEPNNSKSHDIIYTIIEASSLQKSFSDQTGNFLVKSFSGN